MRPLIYLPGSNVVAASHRISTVLAPRDQEHSTRNQSPVQIKRRDMSVKCKCLRLTGSVQTFLVW